MIDARGFIGEARQQYSCSRRDTVAAGTASGLTVGDVDWSSEGVLVGSLCSSQEMPLRRPHKPVGSSSRLQTDAFRAHNATPMLAACVKVVFVTTVYDTVETGPGIYARYLWRAFQDDPDVEFHLVAPTIRETHPRLHAAGEGRGSLDLYRRVQAKAREVVGGAATTTVLHGNNTHSMGELVDHLGPLLVQVNDYQTAMVWRNFRDIGVRQGPRRALSLAWRHRQEGKVLQRATLALCNSHYMEGIVRRVYGLRGDQCTTLYKAVDTDRFRRPQVLPPDPAPERPKGSRLLFVGTDWRVKGLDVLLEAVARVALRVPQVTLTVLGPPWTDPALRKLVSAHDLAKRVFLVGRVERSHLAEHLWHTDAFVLPSRREALGVAVLEAMAAGVPVVASRVGGIPEMVRSEADGVLTEPENPVRLAEALFAVLGAPERRTTLSAAGLRRAQDFSLDRMITTLRTLYRSIAGRDVHAA